jgi:MFS family permease
MPTLMVRTDIPITTADAVPRRAAAYGLAVMTLLNFVNYIDRYVLPAVGPKIKDELGLSDAQLGLLGSAFLFSYLLTSPIFGRLGDRGSRTKLIAIGVGVWSLATAAGGMVRNLSQMFVARGVVGVGEASYASISPALISDYYPPERRGRAFAIFYLAIPVGSAVGYLLGGFLDEHFGWRAAFLAVGLPGVLLALLALTVVDPPRGINDPARDRPAPDVTQPSFSETMWLLARNHRYVLAVLGYAAYTFAVGGLSFWVPIYFNRELSVPLARADFLVGAITVVAGILGTFTGGYLADVLARRSREAYMYLSGWSMVVAVPAVWIALSSRTPPVYLSALFVAEFLVFLSTGPINVVLVTVVPVAIRAMAMAVSIFVIHILGDALAPWLIGAVSDQVGLSKAVLIMPFVVLLSGIIWTGAAKYSARMRA